MSKLQFVLASNNAGKLREMREILSDITLLSQAEAGIHVDPEETGTTFEANAVIKARAAMEASGLPAIADDSGLCCQALGGAPGVYSARYGGEACQDDVARYLLLLRNMEAETDRRASFVSCIACAFPNGDVLTAEGRCAGEIARQPAGAGGFGYDPVFYLPQLGRTMAEISAGEKNRISHRANALAAMKEKLDQYLKENRLC